MMLLVVIAWILVLANAPWWIWLFYFIHIFVSLFNFILDNDSIFNELIKKLK